MATAPDWQGIEIGHGGGDTLAEALLHVRRRKQPRDPRAADAGDPWADSGAYSDEPPF